jgi:hypothetical protein
LYAGYGKETVLTRTKRTDATKAANQIHELFEIFVTDRVWHQTLKHYPVTGQEGFVPHIRFVIEVASVHLRWLCPSNSNVEVYLINCLVMSAERVCGESDVGPPPTCFESNMSIRCSSKAVSGPRFTLWLVLYVAQTFRRESQRYL